MGEHHVGEDVIAHVLLPLLLLVVVVDGAEAREAYLVSSQLFQQAKGFRGRGGSTTQRLDGGPRGREEGRAGGRGTPACRG